MVCKGIDFTTGHIFSVFPGDRLKSKWKFVFSRRLVVATFVELLLFQGLTAEGLRGRFWKIQEGFAMFLGFLTNLKRQWIVRVHLCVWCRGTSRYLWDPRL